jgi:hypothetical protein
MAPEVPSSDGVTASGTEVSPAGSAGPLGTADGKTLGEAPATGPPGSAPQDAASRPVTKSRDANEAENRFGATLEGIINGSLGDRGSVALQTYVRRLECQTGVVRTASV